MLVGRTGERGRGGREGGDTSTTEWGRVPSLHSARSLARSSAATTRGGRTFELFVELPPRGDGEGTDELLEVDCAITVVVKDVEDVVCKLSGITKGEELLVDTAEFFLVERATGAIS